MILQKRIEIKSGAKMNLKNGKSLTIPGLAMDLKFAMQQYKRAQPIDKMIAFYEKEGMTMPDFGMMNTIQRLEMLHDFRKQKAEAEIKLSNIKKKNDEILAEKQAKAKARDDSGSTRTDKGEGSGESKSK